MLLNNRRITELCAKQGAHNHNMHVMTAEGLTHMAFLYVFICVERLVHTRAMAQVYVP